MAGVPGRLHEQTRTAGMQPFRNNCGIGAVGTGESVTLGKIGKRKRWDSQQASSSLHHSGRNVCGSQAMPPALKGSLLWVRKVQDEESCQAPGASYVRATRSDGKRASIATTITPSPTLSRSC